MYHSTKVIRNDITLAARESLTLVITYLLSFVALFFVYLNEMTNKH